MWVCVLCVGGWGWVGLGEDSAGGNQLPSAIALYVGIHVLPGDSATGFPDVRDAIIFGAFGHREIWLSWLMQPRYELTRRPAVVGSDVDGFGIHVIRWG